MGYNFRILQKEVRLPDFEGFLAILDRKDNKIE